MDTTQNQINELTDRVSSLTAANERAMALVHDNSVRASRAESELASLKQVDDARRLMLAETVLSLMDHQSALDEARLVLELDVELLITLTSLLDEDTYIIMALRDALRHEFWNQDRPACPTEEESVQQIINEARDKYRANKEG